jgi:hypothetical protein
MPAMYHLWSWNESTSTWLAVDSGREDKMDAACERQYRGAKEFGLWGTSFVVRSTAPTARPEQLGIEIVNEPKGKDLPIVRSEGLTQHDARLAMARRVAGFEIGDPSWADMIIKAYLDPETAAVDLDAKGA